MTLAELQAATIRIDVAREAYAHAEKRLTDALQTKESHERKAFEILRAYVVLSAAAFGVVGVSLGGHYSMLGLPFFLAGLAFAVGAGMALFALKALTYGAAGSDPSMWLVPSVMTGADERVLPAMLATLTYFHEERIRASRESNRRKAAIILGCVWIGVVTPVLLGFAILLLGR